MKYDFRIADRLGTECTGGFFTLIMMGLIHSIETMGLVDGPGIRCVVFMQGCYLRCKYCHNPDTWKLGPTDEKGITEFSPKQLVDRLLRYKSYFGKDGGVTFSGGEPLLQQEFLAEALRLCREAGIHTCIDTSGVGVGEYEEILSNTDLVLYDVKHFDRDEYEKLTGQIIDKTEEFLKECIRLKKPMWISHVMVPGITDNDEAVKKLSEYILRIPNVEHIRILPYHVLGSNKYKELKIKNPLEGILPMDEKRAKDYENLLNKIYKENENAD